ncbi:MAG: SRPBCC family protein [Saprospiraceae bacterium]
MTIKTVIDIRQPVSTVFKELVNPDNMPKWVEGFVQIDKVKGRRPRRGSISNQIHKDSKGRMELREEILLFERNKKFEIRLSHKNMDTKQSYEFLSQGKSITRVILTTETRLIPAFIGIFSIFMKGGMKRQQEGNLMRFKKLMEK